MLTNSRCCKKKNIVFGGLNFEVWTRICEVSNGWDLYVLYMMLLTLITSQNLELFYDVLICTHDQMVVAAHLHMLPKLRLRRRRWSWLRRRDPGDCKSVTEA